ncbi:MAG: FHA domain-containing protein [Chloroflexota bacterium]|jgi:hypothetical protein
MSHCHECGEAYLDGALFCVECGASLFYGSDSQTTLQVPANEFANAGNGGRPLDHRLGFGTKADRIIFIITSSGRRLQSSLGKTISIGRADARRGIWPEVDLTLDAGAENGVSRRHALVHDSDEGVVLVDLGSTNGTKINDRPLAPERPYLLNNGDSIDFGTLQVRVYFESSVAR